MNMISALFPVRFKINGSSSTFALLFKKYELETMLLTDSLL